MITHEIVEHGKAIKCLVCGLTSYNGNDVKYLFCAFCDMFHDYPEQLKKDIINKNKDKIWKLHQQQNHLRMSTKTFKEKPSFLKRIMIYLGF